MLLVCLTNLLVGCIFSHIFNKKLGFLSIFYLIFSILFINAIILSYNLYYLWLFNENYFITLFEWINLGNNLLVYFAFRIDILNLSIIFVMSTGALFVFWFVFIDMWDDKENYSFFINLGYFLIFMIITVSGSNLFVFYLGWEGIGIMSLVLVSYWSERVRSLKATYKIFFITKIGDFFVLIFICLIVILTNEVDFYNLNTYAIFFTYLPYKLQVLLGLLLLLSGSVKSAQLGFHIWLLEAMEAPLGASALMHSSTLVIAGIVFISKLLFLITNNIFILTLSYSLGLITAFSGAFIACFQFELKVIMAYSTISNMGYLLLLLVTASINEFLYLLIIHAYIKIFLFLTFGAIILHSNGCQDLRWINQLTIYNPTLFCCLILGLANLSGLPFTSGYFCKQSIILVTTWTVFAVPLNDILLLVSYLCTFFYNFRVLFLLLFNPKLGHFSFFKKKNFFLFIMLNFFCLLFIILNYKFFIIIIYDLAINYFSLNYFVFFCKSFLFSTYPQIFYYLYWIFIYWIFFFSISFFLYSNLNNSNFFFKWFVIFLSYFLYILYFLVICF